MADFDVIWPGSMPAAMSPKAAARELLTAVGPFMQFIPPQEPPDWIVPLLLNLRNHPDLDVIREGDWSDYNSQLRFRVKKGHTFREEYIDVGIESSVKANMPLYLRLYRELSLPDTAYQVSVKGVFDFAFFAFGPRGILRQPQHLVPFLDATARELGAAYHRVTPGAQLAFQLEVPAETVFACKLGAARALLLGWLARNVTKLAQYVPAGAPCGVHLCYGDLGHQALVQPRTLAPVVALANAIVDNWPPTTRLDWLHIPMAAGSQPPTLDTRFYAPLSRLRLPETCQLAAGFLHEERNDAQSRFIASLVSRYTDQARIAAGRPPARIALAPSCGCGRRSEAATRTVLQQAATLCTAPEVPIP